MQTENKLLERQQEQTESYQQKWQAFALRHHLALFLLYGWLPACLAFFVLSRFWLHQPVLAAALIVLWLILIVFAVWWAGEFRCPRCSRRYAALGGGRSFSLMRGLFDKICPNCRLAKFETHARVRKTPNII